LWDVFVGLGFTGYPQFSYVFIEVSLPIFKYDYKKRYLKRTRGVGEGKDLVRKTGDSKAYSMPLGSLLLSSIGKSGAILTIYMARHQAVRTTGKSIESRPPFPCDSR